MKCFIKIVAYKKENLGAGLDFIVYYSEHYDVAPQFFPNKQLITPATENAVSTELSAVTTIHRLPQP